MVDNNRYLVRWQERNIGYLSHTRGFDNLFDARRYCESLSEDLNNVCISIFEIIEEWKDD